MGVGQLLRGPHGGAGRLRARAARLLHMGQRVEDAMDFEKDLNLHEEDYNAKPPRS